MCSAWVYWLILVCAGGFGRIDRVDLIDRIDDERRGGCGAGVDGAGAGWEL
jgi:hypothetical protein